MNHGVTLLAIGLILLGMTLHTKALEDKINMLIELAEQDMIEYCVNIQPMEMDYDNNNN